MEANEGESSPSVDFARRLIAEIVDQLIAAGRDLRQISLVEMKIRFAAALRDSCMAAECDAVP